MSWFNESLKNISGQITNLTREVLTEDIEDGGERGGGGRRGEGQ